MSLPALFLDRDGVINLDHGYVHKPEEIEFVDGIFELVAAAKEAGYLVIVVTNQAGIGRGYYSEADFHALMTWMNYRFAERSGLIDAVYFCPYHPECGVGEYLKDSDSRKPAPGMLLQAARELDIDLTKSIIIGDKRSDIAAGRAAGVGVLLQLVENEHVTTDKVLCNYIVKLRDALPYLHGKVAPVSVIVVNWNAGNWLGQCISALMVQTVKPSEIIVFDNASTDGSAKQLKEKFPFVRVIESERNLGFAAANNLAVNEMSPRHEWVAFLNPDAFPESGWLEALLRAAGANPESVLWGSRLMDANRTLIADGVGDVYHASGLIWRAGHGRVLCSHEGVAQEIFSPCAAAAMCRKEAFMTAGGFDEDFFCYVEDVDLGFRLRLLGHKAWYVPDAVVFHVGSALTGHHSDFSIYYGHRNLVWTYIKNMPGLLLVIFLPWHFFINIVSIAYFSLTGHGCVIARAKWDALKGLPAMWCKRREIQSRRVASVFDIWRLLDKRLLSMRRC